MRIFDCSNQQTPGRLWAPATLRRLYARLHPAAAGAVAVAATAFPLAVAVVGVVVCACGCGGGSARIAGCIASVGKLMQIGCVERFTQ